MFHRRLLLLLTKTVDGCCAVDSLSWCAPTTIFRQRQETKKKNLVFFFFLEYKERERERERPVAGEHFYSLCDLISYCVQQFANLFAMAAVNHISMVVFLFFCFGLRAHPGFYSLPTLTYRRAMSPTTDWKLKKNSKIQKKEREEGERMRKKSKYVD